MDSARILISGGAGYIGSHTIRALLNSGFNDLYVLDDLSTGYRDCVPESVAFYQGDIADARLVATIIKENRINTIIHFAAKISVEESVANPEYYYHANTQKSAALIDSALANGIRHFLFSSTAAVYGDTGSEPVTEEAPTKPTNPYGRSKLATEWYLEDCFKATNDPSLRWAALRYFNVAGAHTNGGLGQRNPDAAHLVKMCTKAARGEISALQIFGNDYPTNDGTCIRDYIHVDDLASAHIALLKALIKGSDSGIYNVGYGNGYSVKDVIRTFQRVNNTPFKVNEAPRRAGDSTRVVADASKLAKTSHWRPQYNDLELICKTAWDWEQTLAK